MASTFFDVKKLTVLKAAMAVFQSQASFTDRIELSAVHLVGQSQAQMNTECTNCDD